MLIKACFLVLCSNISFPHRLQTASGAQSAGTHWVSANFSQGESGQSANLTTQPPYIPEIKNAWNFTTTYVFMAWYLAQGQTQPSLFPIVQAALDCGDKLMMQSGRGRAIWSGQLPAFILEKTVMDFNFLDGRLFCF
jgi:hypothetical protein